MKTKYLIRYSVCFGLIALLGMVLFLLPFSLHAHGALTLNTVLANSNTSSPGWLSRQLSNVFNGFFSAIVGLFSLLLYMVSIGFNQAIIFTVVDFTTAFNPIAESVNTAWSSFRDIANIIMIAMFVFVSINVILNIESYGLKKFGANLIIVALLINFSLFFTQATIDISNLLASSFYNSIAIDGEGGIGGTVMNSLGLINESGETKIFEALTEVSGGGISGLGKSMLFTSMVVILSITVSGVLLFGLILLITRMVTLIVLMMLSAPAFAAMLIPGLTSWWSKWLHALIKNAVFAPLFMMLLWASVNIMKPVGTHHLDIASLLSSGGSWTALFNIFIIIGLLYASTKIASELSISGAGFAKKSGVGLMRNFGVGQFANMAFATRNFGAKHLGNGLGRIPGFKTIGAQLNKMPQTTHIGNSQLGKYLNKHGVSLGVNNTSLVAEHQAKIAKERGEVRAKKQAEENLGQIAAHQQTKDNAANNLVAIEAQKSADTARAEADKNTEESRIQTDEIAAENVRNNISKNKRVSEDELHTLERQLSDPTLSPHERGIIEGNAQAAQIKIRRNDANISKLTEKIQQNQKERETLEQTHTTRLESINNTYDGNIATKKDEIEALDKTIKELNDPNYVADYTRSEGKKNAQKSAKEKADSSGRYTLGSTRRLRDAVVKNLGKSSEDIDRDELLSVLRQVKAKADAGD